MVKDNKVGVFSIIPLERMANTLRCYVLLVSFANDQKLTLLHSSREFCGTFRSLLGWGSLSIFHHQREITFNLRAIVNVHPGEYTANCRGPWYR